MTFISATREENEIAFEILPLRQQMDPPPPLYKKNLKNFYLICSLSADCEKTEARMAGTWPLLIVGKPYLYWRAIKSPTLCDMLNITRHH